MKTKALIALLPLFLLSGCSWIIGFYVANTTSSAITLEVQLQKSPGAFPIFNYNELYQYEGDSHKIKWDKQKEVKPDTLDSYAHYRVVLPAHSTLEIGRLHNDKYEKHDQYFINGRVFNLENLIVIQGDKKTNVSTNTFDNYFKKDNGGVFYFVK